MRFRVIYALVALLVALAITPRAYAQSQGNRRLGNVVVTNDNTGSGNCAVTTGNNTATWQSCGGGGSGSPGGSTNSIQYKVNGTTFGGISVADAQLLLGQTGSFPAAVTMSGDCTIADTGAITCLDTNGVAFTSQAFGTSLNLSVPPAIGGTTPAAGSFTNLSSSGTVSGVGFTNYLASPPAIGGTAAAAGSFTALSTLQIANASSTGTTLHKLAKLTGAPSTAVITATTDTTGAIGIVSAGAGTTGTATVTTAGVTSCVFDAATTAGHYVQISALTAGDCTDAGSTYPNSNEVIGQVLSTNGGAGTYNVALQLIQAGVAVTGPGGSNTQAQFNNSGSFAGATNLTINSSTGNVSKITALGPTSITGNQTNGADQINHVNLQGTIDPTTYGADPTGSVDASSILQTVVNTAISSSAPITLPKGTFKTTRPLVALTDNPFEMRGAGTLASTLNATFAGVPLVAMQAGSFSGLGVSLGTALGGNSGHSITYTGGEFTNYAPLDLNEILPYTTISNDGIWGPFNGLSHWSVIAFFKDNGQGGYDPIWASDGNIDNGKCTNDGTPNNCPSFGSLTVIGGVLHGQLNVNGTVTKLSGGTVSNNTCYETELNYDSTSGTINLFLGTCGGTISRIAQATSISGTTVQAISEWDLIGEDRQEWPYATSGWSYGGSIGEIEFLNSSRDTGSSFAGDSTLSGDSAHQIFWSDWATALPTNGPSSATLPLFAVNVPSGAWMVMRNDSLGPATGDQQIHDFTISGGNVSVESVGNTVHLKNMVLGSSLLGLYTQQNATYRSTADTIDVPNARLAALMMMGAIGFANNVGLNFGSAPISTFNFIGNDIDTDNWYVEGNGFTLCGMVVSSGIHKHWNQDDENGGTFPGVCVFASNNKPTFIIDSEIEPQGGSGFSPFKIEGGEFGGLVLLGNHISGASGYTSVVDTSSSNITANGNVNFENDLFNQGQPLDFPGSGVAWVGSNAIPFCIEGKSGQSCFSKVASLPTCATNIEHQYITVTDANAACSTGTTASGSGSTPCQEYCDSSGPAWRETGF